MRAYGLDAFEYRRSQTNDCKDLETRRASFIEIADNQARFSELRR